MQIACFISLLALTRLAVDGDVQGPYRLPNKCEVCKILTLELKARLEDTGRNQEILRLGHGIDENKKKKVHYKKSELRLIEALHEPHICDAVKEYNVHAERDGSNRYAKGMSETMRTLHGLKNKGVKVELGIPYELWDAPNAEVTRMQKECYKMVEDNDEAIEEWYMGDQKQDLAEYLCKGLVLPKGETGCLQEVWSGKGAASADPEDDTDSTESSAAGEARAGRDKASSASSSASQRKGDTGDTADGVGIAVDRDEL